MTCSVISLGGKLASLLQEDIQSEAFKDSDSKALGEKEETLKGIFCSAGILFPHFSYISSTWKLCFSGDEEIMETCNENENVIRRLFQGGLQTFTAPDSKRRSHLIIPR